MSILRVARMGHPVLRIEAAPIPADQVRSTEVQRLVDDMLETVEAYDGAGLAAPQVHHSLRLVVLQVDDERGMEVWINPVLEPTTDDHMVTFEGCLSVPDLRGAVARPAGVRVQALDRHGEPFELELSGYPAVVAQHECDHLDGVLYVDRVDPRTLSFLDELRRHGPWPWDYEEDDEFDEDDFDEDDLDEDELPTPLED